MGASAVVQIELALTRAGVKRPRHDRPGTRPYRASKPRIQAAAQCHGSYRGQPHHHPNWACPICGSLVMPPLSPPASRFRANNWLRRTTLGRMRLLDTGQRLHTEVALEVPVNPNAHERVGLPI